MINSELRNRTLVAAEIARQEGFRHTYEALLEIASKLEQIPIVSQSLDEVSVG